MFTPHLIEIIYTNAPAEAIAIEENKTEFVGQGVKVRLDVSDDGVVTPTLYALKDVQLSLVQIIFNIPEEAKGEDLYYYGAGFTTNDTTSVYKHAEHPIQNMKDVLVAKNTATGANLNVGLITAHRFYACVPIIEGIVQVRYDMEDKVISEGTELTLEKFIYDTRNEFDFLENRYAPLVAKYNSARPLATVPTGWCSWSCYYRNVDEKKITDRIEDMTRIKGVDLFQIDDGWQFDGTFPGDWFIDTKKFPNGLDSIREACNDAGMTFGLWLSPFLVAEKSRYYESVKHLVRTDVEAGCSSPNNIIRLFDLDNPAFYEKLYETYRYLSHELGVKYYKLDFLVFGYFSGSCAITFQSDYKSALFRKVISTIREAVGDDAIMLSCGSPILECAGIFDAQRESRDIIVPKSHDDPFYWQHWMNIKNASKTVLYRYFYNNVVFRNDPDGAVLRDYDIGDGFDCNYAEARYWSTIVAFSGGLVLANDELRHLSKPRQELFTKLIPALGISGRAVDLFEFPAPTKAIIEASPSTKYVARFNLSDDFVDMDVDLSDFGISGDKLVFKCWEARFMGKKNSIHERLVNPHSALMYMVKDVPAEPAFLSSDVNLYLGENVFTSTFTDGGLHISVKAGNEQFVTDTTKVFAFYPKAFASAIGKVCEEKIIVDTDEFVITEYHI